MYEEYKASITSPEIKVAPNSFLVILPKLNLKNEYSLIIEYLKQNNQGTRENFETILKLGKSATINILNEMLEKEKISFNINKNGSVSFNVFKNILLKITFQNYYFYCS